MISRRSALQFALLLALVAVNLHWARPHYNWDVLAYVAVSLRMADASDVAAHEQAYRLVREAVPGRDYTSLSDGDDYRRTTARDPEAFTQQLPFYSVKPAYPLLIAALTRAGVDPVRASVMISRAGYVAIAIILLIWIRSFLPPLPAIAGTWVIMGLPFMLDLARLSTPDSLSTAFVFAALWLLIRKGRLRTSMAVLLLAITVRPDNLLWLLAVAGYGAIHLRDWRASVAFVPAGALCYAVVAAWSGNLGWATLFHHSFVERLAYPATFTPSLSAFGYAWIYLRESHPVHLPPFLLLFVFIGALLFLHRLRRKGWNDRWVAALVAITTFTALHWLVLPGDDRFLVTAYLIVLVLLLRTLAERAPRTAALTPSPFAGPARHDTGPGTSPPLPGRRR